MTKLAQEVVSVTLLMLLVLTVNGMYEDGSCLTCCQCGTLTTSNPYVYINHTLRLACQINKTLVNPDIDSSKLYFTFGRQRISDEYVHIQDNTTLILEKRMESVEEAGVYICRFEDQQIGKQTVELEYPPSNVTDFSCVIFDWEVNMTCTWNLAPYINMNNINVTVKASNLKSYHNCPRLINKTTCIWQNGPHILNAEYWYYVIYIKDIKTGNETQSVFKKNFYKIVKPDCVQNVRAITNRSKCLFLQWDYTPNAKFKEKICKISFNSNWNSTQNVYESGSSNFICDLVPYTDYNFTIQIRPWSYGQETGFWSDPIHYIKRTAEDVPGIAPRLALGNYAVKRMQCEKSMNRTVVIYWKSIPEIYRNSPIIWYKVIYTDDTGQKITFKTMTDVLSQEVVIPCYEKKVIYIQAENDIGPSVYMSSIVIPPVTELVPPSGVLVEVEVNGSMQVYYISWNKAEKSYVENYTVYWCFGPCQTTEIKWKTVRKNTTTLIIRSSLMIIPEDNSNHKFYFGVSSDTEYRSSGFLWEHCLYSRGGAPQSPSQFKISNDRNGLLVVWSEPRCSDGISDAYPFYYKVVWCKANDDQQNCSGDDKKEEDVLSGNEFFIKDLEMHKSYGIRVYSVSKQGLLSPKKKMQYGIPKPSGQSIPAIVMLVILSCLILGIFLLTLLCNIRRIKSYIQSIAKPIEIRVPVISPEHDKKNGEYIKFQSPKTEELPLIGEDKQYEVIGNTKTDTNPDNMVEKKQSSDVDFKPVPDILEIINAETPSDAEEIPSGYTKATLKLSVSQSKSDSAKMDKSPATSCESDCDRSHFTGSKGSYETSGGTSSDISSTMGSSDNTYQSMYAKRINVSTYPLLSVTKEFMSVDFPDGTCITESMESTESTDREGGSENINKGNTESMGSTESTDPEGGSENINKGNTESKGSTESTDPEGGSKNINKGNTECMESTESTDPKDGSENTNKAANRISIRSGMAHCPESSTRMSGKENTNKIDSAINDTDNVVRQDDMKTSVITCEGNHQLLSKCATMNDIDENEEHLESPSIKQEINDRDIGDVNSNTDSFNFSTMDSSENVVSCSGASNTSACESSEYCSDYMSVYIGRADVSTTSSQMPYIVVTDSDSQESEG